MARVLISHSRGWKLGLFGFALFFSVASLALAVDWTCPYCRQTFHFDPRDGSYMESWKQLHLSRVHGGSGSGNAPSPFGGTNPFDGLFGAIGQTLANTLFGNPHQRAVDEARARQQHEQQAAAARLEDERLAREAQLAAIERQQQFAEDKARIFGQMRGFDGRAYDGASTQTAELRVKEVNDIFGTKAVKPAGDEPGVTVGGLQVKSVDFAPKVPPVGPEVETPEGKAERERMRKQILAYQALIDRGRAQLDDFQAAEGLVRRAEAQRETALKAEAEARRVNSTLGKSEPGSGNAPPGGLDDALDALAKAEQASADADRALAEAKYRQAGIEKQMQETLQSLAQMPRPPGWIDQAPAMPSPTQAVPPQR